MHPDPSPTQDLLREARAGDAEAVNRLLERHRQSLRRMVEGRLDPKLKQRVDASDIVQDVLLEANQRLDAFAQDPGVPFGQWLRQLARDRIIDMHRRHRAATGRSVDREQPLEADQSADSGAARQVEDPERTPFAEATWHEVQKNFHEALETLDAQDRDLILLRHFEHMSNEDVAGVLDITPAAASMRHLRALRRFGQQLRRSLPKEDRE